MKKDILTILGCSGSLALTLLTPNVAYADVSSTSPQELIFTAPNDSREQVITADSAEIDEFAEFDCGCSADTADNLTDTDGEKAIALFGCDCAGCRRIARGLTQPEF